MYHFAGKMTALHKVCITTFSIGICYGCGKLSCNEMMLMASMTPDTYRFNNYNPKGDYRPCK
jgi:hypothetical protein